MTKNDPPLADILRDIAEAAPALRAEGVLTIKVGDVEATLAPLPPPVPREEKPPKDPVLGDPDDFFGEPKGARGVS